MKLLNEVGLSRIVSHLSDSDTFAIIGSQDKDTKESRYDELIDLIRRLQRKGGRVGFNNLEGTYTYNDGTVGVEDSLIIYNINKKDALDIAKRLNQESIIWKDNDYFGFMTSDGVEDGSLGRGITFNKDKVKEYGSKIAGRRNNSKGFVFEAFLVESDRSYNKTKYRLLEYKYELKEEYKDRDWIIDKFSKVYLKTMANMPSAKLLLKSKIADISEEEWETVEEYVNNMRFPLTVYRGLNVRDRDSIKIDKKNIGINWTIDKKLFTAKNSMFKSSNYYLKGTVEENQINWEETIHNFMYYSLRPQYGLYPENEVTLKQGTIPSNLEIIENLKQ